MATLSAGVAIIVSSPASLHLGFRTVFADARRLSDHSNAPCDRFTMGVDIDTMKEGDGATFPKSGQKVSCHYVLTLTNGKKVDSSRDRGEPFQFKIGKGEVSSRGHGHDAAKRSYPIGV